MIFTNDYDQSIVEIVFDRAVGSNLFGVVAVSEFKSGKMTTHKVFFSVNRNTKKVKWSRVLVESVHDISLRLISETVKLCGFSCLNKIIPARYYAFVIRKVSNDINFNFVGFYPVSITFEGGKHKIV